MDYKKILEGVVNIINTTEKSDIGFANICTYIGESCPELAESEDEKIRKVLVELVKCNEKSGYFMFNNITTSSMLAWLEKQHEQESVDKVEPKFHEGDWAVSNLDGKARQISEVHFDEYNSYYVVDGKSVNLEEYDRLHHLWTIQDAKDGDVLTYNDSRNNVWVCIFKEYANERVYDYCVLDKESFWERGNWNYLASFSYMPATKEQHNLLFSKMKEAGYEWDAEKKELKEIIDEKQIKKNLQDNSFRRMFEQKPAWSEEDENRINRLIAYFEDKESFTAEDDVEYANWLKSLKHQNRWKESLAAADLENSLCDIQDGFSDTSYEYRILGEAIEFIRCTEPKPQWKPSDEQMEALDAFIEKACAYLDEKCRKFILTAKDIEDFKNYMKGE